MRQMAICGVPDLNKFLENMPENAQIENVLCVKLIKKSWSSRLENKISTMTIQNVTLTLSRIDTYE